MYKDINFYQEMKYKSHLGNDPKGIVLADGEIGGEDIGVGYQFKFIVKNNYMNPCAYVYLPDHMIVNATTEEWFEENIDCHGGVTWCDHYVPGVDETCNSPGYWFGWDYAHLGDYIYGLAPRPNDRKYTVKEIIEDIADVVDQLNTIIKDNYLDSKDQQLMKTFENVQKHCNEHNCSDCIFSRADGRCVITRLCEELAWSPSDWDLSAIKDILVNYALWRV